MNSGPLTDKIAASIEDVKALLDDNRSLSIAYLARRIRDLEDDVRKRFRELKCPCKQVEEIQKLKQRLEQAGIKFNEMREELDKLKNNGPNF